MDDDVKTSFVIDVTFIANSFIILTDENNVLTHHLQPYKVKTNNCHNVSAHCYVSTILLSVPQAYFGYIKFVSSVSKYNQN
jgi:hypothetical protein